MNQNLKPEKNPKIYQKSHNIEESKEDMQETPQNVNINIITGDLANGWNINVLNYGTSASNIKAKPNTPGLSQDKSIHNISELLDVFGFQKSKETDGFIEVIHPQTGAHMKIPKEIADQITPGMLFIILSCFNINWFKLKNS